MEPRKCFNCFHIFCLKRAAHKQNGCLYIYIPIPSYILSRGNFHAALHYASIGCFKRRENIKLLARRCFFAFISKSVNNQCYTTHIHFWKDLFELSYNVRNRKFIAV